MIKQRWEQLSSRDQRTLKIGGVILGVLFFLRMIWWPLFDRINFLSEEIAQEQSLIEWMKPRVAQLLEAKKSGMGKMKKDKSLAGLQKSLQQTGLKSYVTAFSQNAQGQVSVTFAEVPFESCMKWLAQVQSRGWKVEHMNATKGEKSGATQIELVLI